VKNFENKKRVLECKNRIRFKNIEKLLFTNKESTKNSIRFKNIEKSLFTNEKAENK
jgi:hypothetical protein